MKVLRVLVGAAAAAALLAPGAARAQLLVQTENPFAPREAEAPAEARKPPSRRLVIGAFWTDWENVPSRPLRKIQSDFAALGLPLSFDSGSSALLTADYFVTRDLSIGGWWNPQSGTLEGASALGFLRASVQSNFWDVHATYYMDRLSRWTRGLSFQVGFTGLNTDIDGTAGVTAGPLFSIEDAISSYSTNLWLNYNRQVAAPEFRGRRHPLSLFASVGYYTSTQFDNDWNLILGGSLALNDTLSLGGSIWINGLGKTNNDRVTVGLIGRF